MTPTLLPHVVFHFVVEAEGLCPAEALADGLDDLQNVGSDGAMGAVVAVVGISAVVVDEALLDGLLYMSGHVIIEIFAHANRHLDGLVILVISAIALRYMAVSWIHRQDGFLVGIDVLTYFPTQAGSMQRTLIGKTDEVFLGFFSEYGFFMIHSCTILVQNYEKSM